MQRCQYPLLQNQSSHFVLSSLFWKLSQTLGQDQQNSKQTYCWSLIVIFLWTPKDINSLESFLNFLLNLYILPWLQKSFKFIVLRLLQIHLWVKKFCSCPQAKLPAPPRSPRPPQVFIVISQVDRNCPFLPNSIFRRYFFLSRKRVERNMELKKLPKLATLLVTGFDKFHHLYNLYISGLCFVVQ